MSIYLLCCLFFKVRILLVDVKTKDLYLSFHIPLSFPPDPPSRKKNYQCGICSFPNLSSDYCTEIVQCSPYTAH